MKIFQALLIFIFSLAITSCGGNAAPSETTQAAAEKMEATAPESMEGEEEEDPAYTSAYVCPMHCAGSGSEEPGKCSVCGMDYIANSDHGGDGHEH